MESSKIWTDTQYALALTQHSAPRNVRKININTADVDTRKNYRSYKNKVPLQFYTQSNEQMSFNTLQHKHNEAVQLPWMKYKTKHGWEKHTKINVNELKFVTKICCRNCPKIKHRNRLHTQLHGKLFMLVTIHHPCYLDTTDLRHHILDTTPSSWVCKMSITTKSAEYWNCGTMTGFNDKETKIRHLQTIF